MNNDHHKSMWDDPAESSRLRQLLRVGRNAVSDYDVEKGLARHLASIQAGAGLADTSQSLPLIKAASVPFGWVMVPLLAAASFGGVWLATHREVDAPRVAAHTASDGSAERGELDELRTPQLEAAAVPGDEAARRRAEAVSSREAREAARAARAGDERPWSGRRGRAHSADDGRLALRRSAEARGDDGRSSYRGDDARGSRGRDDEGRHAASARSENGLSFEDDSAAKSHRPRAEEQARSDRDSPAESARAEDAPQPGEVGQPDAPAERAVRANDSRLEREMQMLAVAQRVLLDDPSRSLRLARQGDREFAHSMFAAERKQVALLALVQLGRVDEARRLGRPFLEAYPNAPWSARLRQALATGRIPIH
jgi:hypothetical protein